MNANHKLVSFIAILLITSILLSVLSTGSVYAAPPAAIAALQTGANRLVALQNDDGGWGWPLTGASLEDTLGPTGMGLAQAYLHTNEASHLDALQKVGDKLLSKTTFNTHDGYLAAQLDQIFGVTIYSNYVNTNFYNKLAQGNYSFDNDLYSTYQYITYLNSTRTGETVNLAGWDIGMGLLSAKSCEISSEELGYWIAYTQMALENFSDYSGSSPLKYIPQGLAGALLGLTASGIINDPEYPEYSIEGGIFAGKTLVDLFDVLAGYQLASGGIAVHPDIGTESVQATAYAILAWNAYDREKYLNQIQLAANYLISAQEGTGGWGETNEGLFEENNEISAEVLWAISIAYPKPVLELWVCESGDCGHPGASYDHIQDAINTAHPGATIHIEPGLYNAINQAHSSEALITIDKPVSIKGKEGSIIDGAGKSGVFQVLTDSFTDGQIIIEGLEIKGDIETDFAIDAQFTQSINLEKSLIIRNNKIHNMSGGINIYAAAVEPENAIVSNLNILNNDFYNLGVSGAKQGYGVKLQDLAGIDITDGEFAVVIESNTFQNVMGKSQSEPGTGILFSSGPLNFRAINNKFSSALNVGIGILTGLDAANAEIKQNDFNGSNVGIQNFTGEFLDAKENWWGHASGLLNGQTAGGVHYNPWCGNPECSFLVSANQAGELILPENILPEEIQSVLDTAMPGAIIVIPSGSFTFDNNHQGFEVNRPHLTIKLANGAIIQNNSPCFAINADFTTITSSGMASCIATSGSNGIHIAADLKNIILENLDITAEKNYSQGNGIYFAGDIRDIVIRDNLIHDFPDSGLFFTVTPIGIVEISGNAFLNNTNGVVNDGNGLLVVEYNSWGDNSDHSVVGNLDANPWTHAALYLESSDSPWKNQVMTGEEITYTVYGDFENVNAADFTLTYPENLEFVSMTPGSSFALLNNVEFHNSTSRTLHFAGYKNAGEVVSGEKIKLFSVTFSAKTAIIEAEISFNTTLPMFGMPSTGASSNVFPSTLSDGHVTIIDPPSISSNDIQGYYLTNEQREFNLSLSNPLTGGDFNHALIEYRIIGANGKISKFEFFDNETTTWKIMQLEEDGNDLIGAFGQPPTGFHLSPDNQVISKFRIKFVQPGEYHFEFQLVDKDALDEVLAILSKTASVYDAPMLSSSDLASEYQTGVSQEFNLLVENSSTGGDFAHLLYQIQFTGKSLADISQFQYYDTGNWMDISLTADGSGNLIGFLGPINGFYFHPNSIENILFRVTLETPGTYPFEIRLIDLDMNERVLANLSEASGIAAFEKYSVTATISRQGQSNRGGIIMTLTNISDPNLVYSASSANILSQNLNFGNVIAGLYRITTYQNRYLNLTQTLDIQVTIDKIIDFFHLQLIGGNANNDDKIDISDASIVGADYGKFDVSAIGNGGDLNFDGKVNILDLALVGGNFGKQAADYATTWSPQTP